VAFAALAGFAFEAHSSAANLDLVAAARAQIGITIHYDPAYRKLRFPGGDVPADRGVCTDVIVRALRAARGIDLQKQVYEDLRAHSGSKPDPNIDHRRVPNLMTYFTRAGYALPPGHAAADYLPGDIVAWNLGRGILHIGIVSDGESAAGTPFVVHNIGAGAREEDILFRFAVIGHYRLPPPSPGVPGEKTVAAH